ncbi:MAG: metalloregulator ArsR/SmtB family transcription factor [Eubacteriales bacterium]|nr:metalloregulator ArsR/SmtB family transcription factor [Eubacteriales bacterium]
MNTLNYIKALADINRLKILQLLQQKQYAVGELARILDISDSAVSQHLKILKSAGVVRILNKQGHFVYYSINNEVIKNLGAQLKKFGTYPKKFTLVDDDYNG